MPPCGIIGVAPLGFCKVWTVESNDIWTMEPELSASDFGSLESEFGSVESELGLWNRGLMVLTVFYLI